MNSEVDCLCQDAEMLRKQREEIILLTNELKNQEDQIKIFQTNNLKMKEIIKLLKDDKLKLEQTLQKNTTDNVSLKDDIEILKSENENLKSKITQKDFYIQNQSKKILSMTDEINKLKQKLNQNEESNQKLNTELTKLKSNFKDQIKKSTDLRNEVNDLIKTVETKNGLLKLSSNQIENLENNLRQVYGFLSGYMKKSEEFSLLANENEKTNSKSICTINDENKSNTCWNKEDFKSFLLNITNNSSTKNEKLVDLNNMVILNEKQNRTSTPAEFL